MFIFFKNVFKKSYEINVPIQSLKIFFRTPFHFTPGNHYCRYVLQQAPSKENPHGLYYYVLAFSVHPSRFSWSRIPESYHIQQSFQKFTYVLCKLLPESKDVYPIHFKAVRLSNHSKKQFYPFINKIPPTPDTSPTESSPPTAPR